MPKLIATHSGTFHADDVFGVAVLATVFPDHEIIRTRNPDEIARADYVVDVGGVWDPAGGRFDHHQRGFEGARMRPGQDGVPAPAEGYASAGLVWREFGSAYVARMAQSLGHAVDDQLAAKIAGDVDSALVRYIDLVDNGAADVAPGIFGLSSQLSLLNSTWLEEKSLDAQALARLQLERFHQAMAVVDQSLRRFVLRAVGQALAADSVRRAERLLQGRVLLLADGGMPWTRVVVDEMPEVLLVIYPESGRDQYQIRTVPAAAGSFASRMDLPAAWAGLRDEQLAAVTGVADAVFCHMNLFIAGARSKDGALRMALLALDERTAQLATPRA
ncbi:MAG: MYG1 family protein [Ramlibacter sp.]